MTDEPQKMNPEIKAAWVAWLRDPRNQQGREVLRSADGKFCCLGGLCELAVQAGIVTRWDSADGTASRYVGKPDMSDINHATLPMAVVAWAGVKDCNPAVSPHDMDDHTEVLSYVNDNLGYSFDQIADIIEEQL
jgi:hypothetical protein